tara:strand:+ start:115422 stop:115889 length:468 start_codon:yes stop_codon:yes gene_type:complete
VGRGGGFVFELIEQADGGQRSRLGLGEAGAGVGDALDRAGGSLEGLGLEDGGELVERAGVDLAEVECRDRRVGEVFEELVGQVGRFVLVCWCVVAVAGVVLVVLVVLVIHGGIVAHSAIGTRGKWGRSGILRTGVGFGERKAHGLGCVEDFGIRF